MENETLIGEREAAELLGITPGHLAVLVRDGGAHPPYVMVGSRRRYRPSAVRAWIVESERASVRPEPDTLDAAAVPPHEGCDTPTARRLAGHEVNDA